MDDLHVPTTQERITQLEQEVADLKRIIAEFNVMCGLMIRGGLASARAGEAVERRLAYLEQTKR